MPKLKRKLMWPFISWRRKRALYNNIMTPEEIQAEEKRYHDCYIEANRKNQKELEKEFMWKRDAIRRVLKQ